MGLEYHLKPTEQEDLKLELAPRNQCRSYIAVNGRKAILISKKEFDTYYRNK